MSAPFEVRFYSPLYTLDDARKGIQPIRFAPAPGAPVELLGPQVLQTRYRERIMLNGAQTTRWTEWENVPAVREMIGEPAPAAT
jgi:hypothetical protein